MAVVRLLTTVTSGYERVSMHGVRVSLLAAQARAVGLPLQQAVIPPNCSNEQYEEAMREALRIAADESVTQVIFGDLALADVRAYREERLGQVGMTASFPLWGRDTAVLAHEMIDAGLQAIVTCVDPRQAPSDIAGAAFSEELLARLPPDCDPCAENGEFHTFCWDGPMFSYPLNVRVGRTVEREGFIFTDVLEG